MRKTIFLTIAICAILITEIQGTQTEGKKEETSTKRKAQEFTLKNYDGKEVKLSDYHGKLVVLEWFNYDCPFVKYHYEKTKTMAELSDKYKDVVWLAINSTGHATTEKAKKFAEKYNLGYPILDDRSGKVGRAYGAKTTPHMFIVDANSVITYDGAIDNSPLGRTPKGEELVAYVDKALAELTEGKKISTAKTKPYGCSVKYAD